MSKLFILGIGGTGGRVIRALNMLLAANGGKLGDTDVFPIIIDYDVKNGDKLRALDSLERYHQVHHDIYSRSEYTDDGFFRTNVLEMREALVEAKGKSTFNLQYNPPASAKAYSDVIGFGALNGELSPTAQLLKTLYNTSTDQAIAELHIDTTVGFRGNPNIGSVMFNKISDTDEFKEFVKLCDHGDRVVIIGSLFGGTGSSGIPILVNAIRNNSKSAVKDAALATILVCPYFKISPPNAADRKKGVIDDNIFESKTKAALHYYQDSLNSKINAIYYVGDTKKNTLEHNVGAEEQRNPAHIVELVSALAVAHFKELPDELRLDSEKNQWKYGFEVDLDNVENLDFSKLAASSQPDVRKLIAFAIAGRILKKHIIDNPEDCLPANFYVLSGFGLSDDSRSEAQRNLFATTQRFVKFWELFGDWMGELGEGNGHRLLSFDLDAEELCDILKVFPFRKEESNFLGFGKPSMKPTLTAKEFFGVLSPKYKDHMEQGKSDRLDAKYSLTYAFFHSLYEAAQEIVDQKLSFNSHS